MKIDKGVYRPKRHNRKYPFDDMDVGDSVVVDGVGASPRGSRAYGAAMSYGRETGKKFSGRMIPGDSTHIRIWRIE